MLPQEGVELDGVSKIKKESESLATGPQMVPEERYFLPPLIQQFWILGDNEGSESQKVLRLVSLHWMALLMLL